MTTLQTVIPGYNPSLNLMFLDEPAKGKEMSYVSFHSLPVNSPIKEH